MGSVSRLNLTTPSKRSRISQLPSEILEELDQQCLDQNLSLTDIEHWLLSEGFRISTSTIHRHQQKLFKTERIEPVERKQAKLVRETPPSEVSEITLKKCLTRLSAELEVAEGGRELATISRAIAEVSRSLRQMEKWKAEEEAMKPKEKRSAGLSEDAVDQIKRDILGIVS